MTRSVVGIDEVGRGSWAGPLLVVAARPTGALPLGLADSKLLTRKQREALFYNLTSSFQFGEGWVEPNEIDQLGLTEAMKLGVKRALVALDVKPADEIIMDGHINFCPDEFSKVRCVIKADSLHPVVSAASIYAKVSRDSKMTKLAKQFPGYGFEKHVGYGTKAHSQAIKKQGICQLHRLSYKPVKVFV